MQTPEHVAFYYEMYHDLRIIPLDRPLDRRPHIRREISHWLGDSRGHWDADTLVVETTNFEAILWRFVRDDFNSLPGEDPGLVERFTRIDVDTLTYEFTMDDRTTGPGQGPLRRSGEAPQRLRYHETCETYGSSLLGLPSRQTHRI